jgi:hypothetical protein
MKIINVDDRVSFMYHGKSRVGRVVRVGTDFFVLQHENAAEIGRDYSSYKIDEVKAFSCLNQSQPF